MIIVVQLQYKDIPDMIYTLQKGIMFKYTAFQIIYLMIIMS